MANTEENLNEKEKLPLSDIFRMIGKNTLLFFCTETKVISTIDYFYRKELERGPIDFNEELKIDDPGKIIRLPSFEEINHKDIMTYYVKECVEDKKNRQKLFYILRNHDYMDKFIDAIKELNLYEEYIDVTDDIYVQISNEWLEEKGVSM